MKQQVRVELDLWYRVTGQSAEIFGIRPVWKGTRPLFILHDQPVRESVRQNVLQPDLQI